MRHLAIALVGVLFIAGSAAQAQFLPRPSGSPPTAGAAGGASLSGGIGAPPASGGFSPYLNLLRGGNSPAVNYFGIVRPQFNFRSSLQSLQQQQTQMQASMSEPDDPTMPGLVVGTQVRFLNTGGYFLNLNGNNSAASGNLRGAAPTAPTALTGQGAGSGFASSISGFSGGLLGSSPGGRGTGAKGPR